MFEAPTDSQLAYIRDLCDWREGDQLPDPLEDERNDRLEPAARPSLNPES